MNFFPSKFSLYTEHCVQLMFSGSFTKSFKRLEMEMQNLVLLFLSKLANGWRPKRDSVVSSESSAKILKQYKIGRCYILCSVDIYKELRYIQTLKVWEILPLQDISKMIKRLEHIFQMYTEDYISRCSKKCVDGYVILNQTFLLYPPNACVKLLPIICMSFIQRCILMSCNR